jgi:ADP-ribose pyrophosphatase YjhB (NUDIX family)
LPEDIYAQALDALVICCVDAALLHRGHWLIARRAQEPHPDWWVIGGRMRKGELIEEALRRTLRREVHLDLPEERLRRIIGYYNLIWDTRAQEPVSNGCQLFSITVAVSLTEEERAQLVLNEEYGEARWVEPQQVISQAEQYHPCLVQMAKDLLRQSISEE